MSAGTSTADNALMGEFLDDFFAECDEHLGIVRRVLLALDPTAQQSSVDSTLADTLLRSFHSLKGLAGMASLPEAEQLAHQMESYLRASGQGRRVLTVDAWNALLTGTALIEQVIAAYRMHLPLPDIAPMMTRLMTIAGAPQVDEPAALASVPGSGEHPGDQDAAGTHLAARPDAHPDIPLWRFAFAPTPALTARGITVDAIRSRLQELGAIVHAAPQVPEPGKIVFEFLVATDADVSTFAAWQDDGVLYTRYVPERSPSSELHTENGNGQGHRTADEPLPVLSVAPSHMVRVDLAHLDSVIEMLGELVIERAHLDAQVGHLKTTLPASTWRPLQETSQALERHLRTMRHSVMRMRLVPIGDVFARMRFVVQTILQSGHKEVTLELQGQETEIDKFVVERMHDPLLHLVRNAISHGLEAPEERLAQGKPPTGLLVLRAATAGDMVVVEIEDDGRGIDVEQVARRARAAGLLAADEELDPRSLLDVLCWPSFSTAEQVDRVRGRGLGMTIVKNTIAELGGTLALATELGQGTRFTIHLPLTLAIVDALIVAVGGQIFAVPLTLVVEVMEAHWANLTTLEHNDILPYHGSVLPLAHLARRFGIAQQVADKFYVLVVGQGLQAVGIAVDRITAKREIVVRPITDPLLTLLGFVGATELGNGQPVLIVDTITLNHIALSERRRKRDTREWERNGSHRVHASQDEVKERAMRESNAPTATFVLFELAGTTYGLPSDVVQQLEMVEHITPVPNAPACLAGIVFSRGQVVPAVDLRACFGLEKVPYTLRSRLIIVRVGERTVGLLVDTAREFMLLPVAAIQPPPEAITGLRSAYLAGVAILEGRLIVLLDLDAVLKHGDIAASVREAGATPTA